MSKKKKVYMTDNKLMLLSKLKEKEEDKNKEVKDDSRVFIINTGRD